MNSNQHHYSRLFECFSRLGHTLPQDVKDEITASTYLETFEKNDIILPYNQICQNVYFISEGLVMVKYKWDQKERIQWFMMEGDVFISVESFFYQVPSEFCIVALEDTQCISMPFNTLEDITDRHKIFNKVDKALTRYYYAQASKNLKLISMRASERCAYLYRHHRQIYNRVTDYHKAWFLGMEQQTFSKVQKKMLENEGL